ncbi:uncharacterized protein LOC135225392 [Macrobrachium nipponense]|uniref:uncharacterized protein LOC135225392 n=1 Tax=Macrobrachium nipponense TaxID=159736 RepID=UPI0030C7A26F
MDPGKIFQIITNSTLLATRLLSEPGRGFVEFSQSRYCAVVNEATPISGDVITVSAIHSKNGPILRYSILEGNEEGLFKIDEVTGVISLADSLDFERRDKHELVVSAETAEGVTGSAKVRVVVEDANDSPPVFLRSNPVVTVIEDDDRHLPAVIAQVTAMDLDALDEDGLIYRVAGDGIDGYPPDEAFFTINKDTGDLIQLKALDRDPPHGKGVWKLRVEVADGQAQKRHQEKNNGVFDIERGSETATQPHWKYFTKEDDFINSSTGPDVLDEDNAILGERFTDKRNGKGPRTAGEGLRDAGSSSNVRGWKITGRRRKESPDEENEEEEEEQGRTSLEAAKENAIWDHRQKRHSDSQVTENDETFVSRNKGDNSDRSPDRVPWEVSERFTDKTNRRLFIKRSYWKEVKGDPEPRKNFLYPNSYQIWQNIEGDRHQKKQVVTREAQRQFWVSADNRRYPGRYQTADDPCSRNGRKRKCRYRYKKGPGAWIRHNGSENDRILSGDIIREENELNEENKTIRITRVRRKANERRRRDSLLEHDWTDEGGITNRQKWGKYKRAPLARAQTQGKSFPEGKLGAENYILTWGVLRGVSEKEPRHLQGSRLKRMRSRETQKALGKNQVRSLRHFTASSLEASVNEGDDDDELGDVDEGSGRELAMVTLTRGEGRDGEPSAFLGVKSGKLHGEAGGKNDSLKARIINRKSENARKRKESRKRRNISYHMTRRGDGGNSRSRPKTSSITQRPRSHFRSERSNARISFKEREDKMNDQKKRKRERNEFYLDHKTKISSKRNEDSRKQESSNRTLFWEEGEMPERKIKSSFQGELNTVGRTSDENPLDSAIQTFQKTQVAEKLHNVRHNDVKRVSKRRAMLKRGYGENRIPAKSLGVTKLPHIGNYGFPVIPHDGDGDKERETKGHGSYFHVLHLMGHTDFSLNQKTAAKRNKNIHLSRQRMDGDKDESLDRLSEKPTYTDIYDDTIKLNKTLSNLTCVNKQKNYADICNHSNVQFTNSWTAIVRRDPNLEQTKLPKSDDIQNARGTNFPFHILPAKSNEKIERVNRQHKSLSEEPEQRISRETKGSLKNPKSLVFPRSKEINHFRRSFNSSMDSSSHPKTKKEQGTFEGPASSSKKTRKPRRRELHQNGNDESCTRAENGNSGIGPGRVHKVTTTVTIIVKDINDNAPVFPESVITGEVEENGQLGLSVARISAWDADDRTEGLNGRITYAIEKNVIDEDTGRAIFNVDPKTGVIRTALCCLDRETTPEYQIQVVATDGGGLKGTGTVVIRIGDENDNSPEFPSERFELEVDETWGNGDPDPVTPIMEVTCFDPDVRNDFLYRIMERSGWGWDYFDVRSEGRIGQLYARKPLDYENPSHRRELAFKLQVTDRGEDGWLDPTHVDTAWVIVQIKDVNDNAPVFETTHAQISVREDVPQGTILATFRAHDPDMGGKGVVDYKIIDYSDFLEVDDEGVVRIKTESFDREALEDEAPVIRIVAVDRGQPPLTSTASLSLSVMDMNDSPPYILPPTVFHVLEGVPPAKLGLLKAYDEDSWALGNGPPFNISLAPSNQDYIYEFVELRFDKKLDSGRGAATLWTRKPVDREKHHQLDVRVILTDARGLANEQTVTVVVDDVNDNPMKPGKKTIYLYKIQGRGGSVNVPLGRVYVDDPDDWDLKDKTFKWATSAHPLFTLDQQEGTIYASSLVREGRYLLQFSVSDRVSRQRGVSANVTVIAKTLNINSVERGSHHSLSRHSGQNHEGLESCG